MLANGATKSKRKITNQIREINYELKQAEDVKKRDVRLEIEWAQVELQQQHEKHERDQPRKSGSSARRYSKDPGSLCSREPLKIGTHCVHVASLWDINRWLP